MPNIPENPHRELADVQSEWVCNRLKQLRYLACLSLAEAGERLACDPKSIAAVERGRYASPLSTIAAYVSAYGVSLADFFALCPSAVPKKKPKPLAGGIAVLLGGERGSEETRFAKYMCERYSHLSNVKWDAHIMQVMKTLKAEKAKQAKAKKS